MNRMITPLVLSLALSSPLEAKCTQDFKVKKSSEISSMFMIYRYIDWEGPQTVLLERKYKITPKGSERELEVNTTVIGYASCKLDSQNRRSTIGVYTNLKELDKIKVKVVPIFEQSRMRLYLKSSDLGSNSVEFAQCLDYDK